MEQRLTFTVFEINGQGAFVAMQVLLIWAATTTGNGIALGILSRRRLNFNHIGALISQEPNRHRPGTGNGQI